jgi:ElaA protein
VELRWYERAFAELSGQELYGILALRSRVFVIEQACVYLDLDGLDPGARHLWAAADGVVACLRILAPGAQFAEASIGRVATAPEVRGTGLGRELMRRGLAAVGGVPVRIAAQCYLERFYAELGFVRAGEPYLEDGIAHVDMLRS